MPAATLGHEYKIRLPGAEVNPELDAVLTGPHYVPLDEIKPGMFVENQFSSRPTWSEVAAIDAPREFHRSYTEFLDADGKKIARWGTGGSILVRHRKGAYQA